MTVKAKLIVLLLVVASLIVNPNCVMLLPAFSLAISVAAGKVSHDLAAAIDIITLALVAGSDQ